jgi:gamma-glutamylputrescine oxidase
MSISYWQAQVGLPAQVWQDEAPAEVQTDLCVIGAGIIGSATAYWASTIGLRGVVVEAREPAMGASGRNAGFILSGISDNYYRAIAKYGRDAARELWALSIDNRNTMIGFAERFGVPVLRCGSLLLAESEQEAEELELSADLLAEDGFPGEYLARDPLDRGFLAALRRPGDGVTQPALLTRQLLRHSGFKVVTGAPVSGIVAEEGGVRIEGPRVIIHARHVILATNAWSATLHPYFKGKVLPMRGQILVTEPVPTCFDTAGYSHFGYWYFRQIPERGLKGYGRWLIGGGRHLHFDTENDNPDESISGPVQSDLEAWTARHFPEVAGAGISHRWAGTMGFTPDGLPLVGRLPDQERVAFAVGFNGHGMGLGVLLAKKALDLLMEQRPPGLFDAVRLEHHDTRI